MRARATYSILALGVYYVQLWIKTIPGVVSERKKKKARFTIIYHIFFFKGSVTRKIIPIYNWTIRRLYKNNNSNDDNKIFERKRTEAAGGKSQRWF